MGAGSSKSPRQKHKAYPFPQPGYPSYNSAYVTGYAPPGFVPPGYGQPFAPTQGYAPGFPVPAPTQSAHQSTKRKKTKRKPVGSAAAYPPEFHPGRNTEVQPPTSYADFRPAPNAESRPAPASANVYPSGFRPTRNAESQPAPASSYVFPPDFRPTRNSETQPALGSSNVYPPDFRPTHNAEVQPPHPSMPPARSAHQHTHPQGQGPVIPPPPILSSQNMTRPVYNDAPPPPPPLFTPRTRPNLTGFPSPQVGQTSNRRAQTPFNPPMAIIPDDTEDGSEQSHSHQNHQFDQRQNQSSSHHGHEPDVSHILRPVDDGYGPPFLMGPTFDQDPLLRNPLPPPPRDLYDLTPYKSLINLPHGTALLTAAYAQTPQRSRTQNRPKKKERKGLFRSLTSRRRDEDEDEIFDEPSVRYVPVFVPAQSQPMGHSGEGSSTGFPVPSSTTPAPPQTQSANAASDSSHIRFNQQSRFAGFMNHSPHRVLYANKTYPSATHLHEALKYLDHRPDLAERIRTCQDIKDVYPLSASFQHHQRPDWGHAFLKVMEEVLLTKFKQHPDLRNLLLHTENAALIYTDQNDTYWGDGSGNGANELGKALMRVRDALRQLNL